MGEHAGHDHNHAVVTEGNAKKLTFALALTTIFLIIEVIAGFITQSLALLSDAAHMFTDAAALAIALVAIKIGKLPADDKRTFGYQRFEILAALFNACMLFMVVISIAMWIFGNGAGPTVQIATVVAFIATVIAGLLFWRDLPDFKISMQSFMQANKEWKCRDCNHQWKI